MPVDFQSLCCTLPLLRAARGHGSLSWHDSKHMWDISSCTTSCAFLPTLAHLWLSPDVFQVEHLQKMMLLFWSSLSYPWGCSQRLPISPEYGFPGLYACVFQGGIKRGRKDCHISAGSPELQTTCRTLLCFLRFVTSLRLLLLA